ncbi:pyridoxal phosphate-dependent aminotransferase [Paenalkalicoccus suaedae]|uniref:Pyridoxal phosphate-dependent aminotransferase n=1 Tax=Paenalkalicoccus suaedae TaxID=2592382 RepID=A0A859FAR2_9BACI|nr:pyridoxal phosphate-dependent aminotransferase [Paenalkalicoccus suaedae]QKS69878.1 pyridoxal phosphate-dependent aminotransferase [Paenalkalicoccus suaedae]
MTHFEQSALLKRLPDQFFARLTAKVRNLVAEGHDVINLGQGNPDLPTPAFIVKELQQAATNPSFHQYSPFSGHTFLKEAVATFYKREYDVTLDPETEVAVLFGAKTGLVEISQCLLNPGDVALLPDPGYPDYTSGIALAEARASLFPLLAENHFLPDYDSFSQQEVDKAKLLFLNYPNNPTAGVATNAFFDETVAFAADNNICVVHDLAYGAIGFDGVKPPSFLQSEGAKDVGVEMYTLSKTYNMAGWRVGFAVGNASVIESINLLQDHMYVSLFGAIQHAAAAALLSDQRDVTELVARYESRRNVFIEGLRAAGLSAVAPKGSFFVWLPVPEGFSSESFADFLLKEAHIVVAPGNGFGEYGEGYVRIGLLADEERLREAVGRIAELELVKRCRSKD